MELALGRFACVHAAGAAVSHASGVIARGGVGCGMFCFEGYVLIKTLMFGSKH